MLHEIIEAMVERVELLDVGEELTLLARHAQVGSPGVLDQLARGHSTDPNEEAGLVAITQLRLLEEFATQLRWLEALSEDEEVDSGVRVGLAGLLVLLCSESELPERVDSDAAVVLEPALLLHGLLAHLRPWLPSFVPAFEGADFELLRLGVPDYVLVVLHERFNRLWTVFHRLRLASWLSQVELESMPDDFQRDPRFRELATPRIPAWPPMGEHVEDYSPRAWAGGETSQSCAL